MHLNPEQDAERAQWLMDAAHELVRRRGANFTAHQLSQESGVCLSTMYRQFGGKDGVLIEVIADVIDETCLTFRQRLHPITDPIQRLEGLIRLCLRSAAEPRAQGFVTFLATEYSRLQAQSPRHLALAFEPVVAMVRRELAGLSQSADVPASHLDATAVLTVQLVTKCVLDFRRLGPAHLDDLSRALVAFCRAVWQQCESSAPKVVERQAIA